MDENEASVRRVAIVVLGLIVALVVVLVADLVVNGRPVADVGKFLLAGLVFIGIIGGVSLAGVTRRRD